MPDHVFSHKDGIEDLAVVDQESLTNEVRRNSGTARPSLYWPLDAGIIDFIDLFEEMLLHKRPLFKRSAHTFL